MKRQTGIWIDSSKAIIICLDGKKKASPKLIRILKTKPTTTKKATKVRSTEITTVLTKPNLKIAFTNKPTIIWMR